MPTPMPTVEPWEEWYPEDFLENGDEDFDGGVNIRALWPYLRATCPDISEVEGECRFSCSKDTDCPPLHLCCSNGCGRQCVLPQVTEEATCGCSAAFISDKMPIYGNMSMEEITYLNEFLAHSMMQSISPSVEVHFLNNGFERSFGGSSLSTSCDFMRLLNLMKVQSSPELPYFDPFNKPHRKLISVLATEEVLGSLEIYLFLKEIFQTICVIIVDTEGAEVNESVLDSFASDCIFRVSSYSELFIVLPDILSKVTDSCECPDSEGGEDDADDECPEIGSPCQDDEDCAYLNCINETCQLAQCPQPDIITSFGYVNPAQYDYYYFTRAGNKHGSPQVHTKTGENMGGIKGPQSFPFYRASECIDESKGESSWTKYKDILTEHNRTDESIFRHRTHRSLAKDSHRTRRQDQHYQPDFTPFWLTSQTLFSTGCCHPGLLHCSGYIGLCLFSELVCDGVRHCINGEDEDPQRCSARKCDVSEYRCDSGQCILDMFVCDGKSDCTDGSDEFCQSAEDCPPPRTDYCGSNNDCIPPGFRCDGILDCRDGSDEWSCNCTEFKCISGECISNFTVCDGKNHCVDGSDEISTMCQERSCLSYQYQCNSGICIYDQQVCTGYPDCNDDSDEGLILCQNNSCPYPYWQCESGECIYYKQVCDKVPNCKDGSDESLERACSECAGFLCDSGQCFWDIGRCNGNDECPDGSDEKSCETYQCVDSEFHCESGECIDRRKVLDGRVDCADGSDETGQGLLDVCRQDERQRQCSTGECLHEHQVCNGVIDCQDRADEIGCLELDCPRDRPYQCASGQCIENSDARCNALTECIDGSDEINCDSFICPFHRSFQCFSGTCISKNYQCDGRLDCLDRSDEAGCDECPFGDNFRCKTGECIWGGSVCDYNRNCFGGSDEAFCMDKNCTLPHSFGCKDGGCIYDYQECDGYRNCIDGSDEVDCGTKDETEDFN